MVIPYARTYTATMKGATLKPVHCEACQADYVYRYEASASGSGTSLLFLNNKGAAERARESAEKSLGQQLERGIDAVPCPQCGHYQERMFRILRKRHQRWMYTLGWTCIVLAVLAFFVSFVSTSERGPNARLVENISFGCGIGLGIAGLGLVIVRMVLASQFQPNAGSPEPRLAIARERAMLRKDLEALLAAQAGSGGDAGSA